MANEEVPSAACVESKRVASETKSRVDRRRARVWGSDARCADAAKAAASRQWALRQRRRRFQKRGNGLGAEPVIESGAVEPGRAGRSEVVRAECSSRAERRNAWRVAPERADESRGDVVVRRLWEIATGRGGYAKVVTGGSRVPFAKKAGRRSRAAPLTMFLQQWNEVPSATDLPKVGGKGQCGRRGVALFPCRPPAPGVRSVPPRSSTGKVSGRRFVRWKRRRAAELLVRLQFGVSSFLALGGRRSVPPNLPSSRSPGYEVALEEARKAAFRFVRRKFELRSGRRGPVLDDHWANVQLLLGNERLPLRVCIVGIKKFAHSKQCSLKTSEWLGNSSFRNDRYG